MYQNWLKILKSVEENAFQKVDVNSNKKKMSPSLILRTNKTPGLLGSLVTLGGRFRRITLVPPQWSTTVLVKFSVLGGLQGARVLDSGEFTDQGPGVTWRAGRIDRDTGSYFKATFYITVPTKGEPELFAKAAFLLPQLLSHIFPFLAPSPTHAPCPFLSGAEGRGASKRAGWNQGHTQAGSGSLENREKGTGTG